MHLKLNQEKARIVDVSKVAGRPSRCAVIEGLLFNNK